MMRSSLSVLALLLGSLGVVACASEAEEPPPATVASPMIAAPGGGGGDCSTTLGTCYQACQGGTPTPTEQCFTNCTNQFNNCIR